MSGPYGEKGVKEVCEEIREPIENFDIRKMILDIAVPFEWATTDRSHPVEQLGYFYFGIGDSFCFNEEKVNEADELLLWKLYALTQNYWLIHYEEWYKKASMKYDPKRVLTEKEIIWLKSFDKP